MIDYTKLTDSEIDRLVAEKIRGWHVELIDRGVLGHVRAYKDDKNVVQVFCYSYYPTHDMNQAIDVIEKSERGITISYYPFSRNDRWLIGDRLSDYYEYTNNPARTICIALLEAEEARNDTDK